MTKTILYYTSNREKPEFEQRIQANILAQCGDLPIISVSQKPINFGKNICVGDIGHSYESEFKQIKIGAEAIKTDYIIFCEADTIYPKEYFEFEPMGDSVYRNENDWVLFCYKKGKNLFYHKKPFIVGTQICKRDDIVKYGFREHIPFTVFKTEVACISFKTGNGMTKRNRVGERISTLPYWGDSISLSLKYI